MKHYIDILNENGLKWETKSMRQADISTLDGKAVMALLTGAVRAVRYCEGILLEFCMDGTMIKWLRRLKELDEESIV